MPAKPVKVLVVDDESAMRRALSASLTASGYVVADAQDGEDSHGDGSPAARSTWCCSMSTCRE